VHAWGRGSEEEGVVWKNLRGGGGGEC